MNILVTGGAGYIGSHTAVELMQQGYDVTAVNCLFYKNEQDDGSAVRDARAVAEKLGIDFRTEDLTEPFLNKVIDNFVDTYVNGGTPNPCIVCKN